MTIAHVSPHAMKSHKKINAYKFRNIKVYINKVEIIQTSNDSNTI